MQANGRHEVIPKASATFPLSRPAQRAQARDDIVRGARAYRVWGTLPLIESLDLLRRTIVGPFVPILNRGLTFFLTGLLFRELLDMGDRYLAHLVVGLVVWFTINSFFVQAGRTLIDARTLILQTDSPVSIHVFETVWRVILDFGFSVLPLLAAAIIVGRWPDWRGLLAIPGILLIALNGFWVTLLLATLSLKHPILIGVTRRTMVGVFVATPILWMAHQFPNRQALIQLNPFHHAVEVVRGPLLGNPPPLDSWAIVAGAAVVGWFTSVRVYAHFRQQIPFLV